MFFLQRGECLSLTVVSYHKWMLNCTKFLFTSDISNFCVYSSQLSWLDTYKFYLIFSVDQLWFWKLREHYVLVFFKTWNISIYSLFATRFLKRSQFNSLFSITKMCFPLGCFPVYSLCFFSFLWLQYDAHGVRFWSLSCLLFSELPGDTICCLWLI